MTLLDELDFNKTHYVVSWSIDAWADNPREAAEKAREIMTAGGSATTIFHVEPYAQDPLEVDLEIEDSGR